MSDDAVRRAFRRSLGAHARAIFLLGGWGERCMALSTNTRRAAFQLAVQPLMRLNRSCDTIGAAGAFSTAGRPATPTGLRRPYGSGASEQASWKCFLRWRLLHYNCSCRAFSRDPCTQLCDIQIVKDRDRAGQLLSISTSACCHALRNRCIASAGLSGS